MRQSCNYLCLCNPEGLHYSGSSLPAAVSQQGEVQDSTDTTNYYFLCLCSVSSLLMEHLTGGLFWVFSFFFIAVVVVTRESVQVQTNLVISNPTCLIVMWQKYRQFCCISSSTALSQRQGHFHSPKTALNCSSSNIA